MKPILTVSLDSIFISITISVALLIKEDTEKQLTSHMLNCNNN